MQLLCIISRLIHLQFYLSYFDYNGVHRQMQSTFVSGFVPKIVVSELLADLNRRGCLYFNDGFLVIQQRNYGSLPGKIILID
jgi:hypothetical protein